MGLFGKSKERKLGEKKNNLDFYGLSDSKVEEELGAINEKNRLREKKETKRGWFKRIFSSEEDETTPIATSSWINVYYRILFKPNKDMKGKKLQEELNKKLNDFEGIVANIEQIVDDGKIIAIINPYFGPYTIGTDRPHKEFLGLHFKRSFTFMFEKSKEHKGYWEFWIKSKERRLGMTEKDYGKSIIKKKGDKWVYGYSPIDFVNDEFLLRECYKQICWYFKIPSDEFHLNLSNTVFPHFNERGEPMIKTKIGFLFIEYRVIDRLELMRTNPELEEKCFSESLETFNSYYRNNKDETVVRWLKEVDKLLENNGEK